MLKISIVGYQKPSPSKLNDIYKPKILIRLLITLGVYSILTIPVSAQITSGGDKTEVNSSKTNPN
jgi:hypothetical protein